MLAERNQTDLKQFSHNVSFTNKHLYKGLRQTECDKQANCSAAATMAENSCLNIQVNTCFILNIWLYLDKIAAILLPAYWH